MKFNKIFVKYLFNALVILSGQFVYNPIVHAANYSVLEEQRTDVFSFSPTLDQGRKSSDQFFSVENTKKEKYLLAFDHLKKNQLEKANAIIVELLKLNPLEVRFINLNALLNELQDNAAAAKQNYKKALKQDGDNLTAILGLAKLDLQGGNVEQAKKYVDKAFQINDRSLNVYFLYLTYQYQLNKYL